MGAAAEGGFKPLTMQSKEIPITVSEKHLGNYIGENAQENQVEMSIRELYSSANLLIAQFHSANTDVKYRLLKTFCMSLYGSPIWNFENMKLIQRFLIAWRKCLKRLLDISMRTHTAYLYCIVNDNPVENQLHKRFIKFFRGCTDGNSYTRLCVQLVSSGSQSNICNSVNHITHLYGLNRSDFTRYTDQELLPMLSTEFPSEVVQHVALITDFLDFRSSNKELYRELSDILNYLCEMNV